MARAFRVVPVRQVVDPSPTTEWPVRHAPHEREHVMWADSRFPAGRHLMHSDPSGSCDQMVVFLVDAKVHQ